VDRAHIVAADRKHVWRPYTSGDDHQALDPIVVASAEGAWLEDLDGHRYLDANGSWWVNNLGYRHPRLVAALRRQSEALVHCSLGGCTHAPAALLAEELAAVAPEGLTRAFYVDNGSTSVEVAMKMAFQYWAQNGRPRRQRFLALPGAYHGDTVGAMSVGALDAMGAVFRPLLFETNDAPEVRDPGAWDDVFESLCARVIRDRDTLAAVIVEPLVQGAAGMRMYTPEHLRALREACDRADVFLIADEVFTGCGRTGCMWACDHAGVSPDLLCAAKGLSGGVLPFGVTLATERIYDGFRGDATRALLHGHTFCGNPLGAAVAREVLAIYREEDVLGQVAGKARRVAEAFADIPGVLRPRSLGMIGACDLGDEGYYGRAGWHVAKAARERGVCLRPLGDVVYVVPPLNVGDDELETMLRVVREAIEATRSQWA